MKHLVLFFTAIIMSGCSKTNDILPEPTQLECSPIGLAEAHTLHNDFQDIIDNYVSMGFPGMTALVYTPDNGLWIGASGKANISRNIEMANCNSFFSGSVAKMYTVTAAMTLYEEGLLDLDANISNYLPEVLKQNLPNAQTATIRQIMNHSAGMPDHDDEEDLSNYIESNNGNLPSAIEQLSYLFDNSPNFPAGSSAEYSSAHTVALSLVIDSISGTHHSNIISDKIINRLGLQETYYKNEVGYPSPSNIVSGYYGTRLNNDDITQPSSNYALGSQGDAGIIATAHDYFLFMKGLISGNIINMETYNTMINEALLFDNGTYGFGFGLGLFMMTYQNNLVKIGHSGETLGGMSHVYYYPTKDSYLVVLTNTILDDDDEELLIDWTGSTLTNTGTNYMIDKFESLILD